MNNEYLSSSQIIAKLQVPISASTLRKWADAGRIRSRRPGGKRYYHFEDVEREIGEAPLIGHRGERQIVGYARVSSRHQIEDLKRQERYIREHSEIGEEGKIIKDIGSGLNYNRKGLLSLLSRVERGEISTVVVTYRDRLCRFGIELIERILRKNNATLVVLCAETVDEDVEVELAHDLLDVCNYFVAKRNGQKAARYRRERTASSSQVSSSSDEDSEAEVQIVVRGD